MQPLFAHQCLGPPQQPHHLHQEVGSPWGRFLLLLSIISSSLGQSKEEELTVPWPRCALLSLLSSTCPPCRTLHERHQHHHHRPIMRTRRPCSVPPSAGPSALTGQSTCIRGHVVGRDNMAHSIPVTWPFLGHDGAHDTAMSSTMPSSAAPSTSRVHDAAVSFSLSFRCIGSHP